MIQTIKINLINRIHQIRLFSILKNQNHRYFNKYIIKFINFISIYYTIILVTIINLNK